MEAASSKPRRSFQIEVALLIASTALGLLMTRECFRAYDSFAMFDHRRHAPRGFRRWGFAFVPLFVSWSLVLPLVHLCSPRTRLRRMAHLPGLVPSGVVALLSLYTLVNSQAYGIGSRGWVSLQTSLWWTFVSFPSAVVEIGRTAGFAIGATWLVLGLGGWWRPEASWVDRFGRILGIYWIAMYVIRVYYNLAS